VVFKVAKDGRTAVEDWVLRKIHTTTITTTTTTVNNNKPNKIAEFYVKMHVHDTF
jgi:hypothetical protein